MKKKLAKRGIAVITWILGLTFIILAVPTFAQDNSRANNTRTFNNITAVQSKSAFPGDFVIVNVNSSQTLTLGDRSTGDPSQAQRQVRLSKSFYIGKYPVTIWEYARLMRDHNYYGGYSPNQKSWSVATPGLLPMNGVSWLNAIEYCNARSRLDGLTPVYTIQRDSRNAITGVTWNKNANGWRLPTDSEWEVAARAGTSTKYHYGASLSSSQARINTRSGAVMVGTYRPNAWGLYDVHGNVWEWCWDWYDDFLDSRGNPRSLGVLSDPSGPSTKPALDTSLLTDIGVLFGDFRVMRGGSWADPADRAASAFRAYAFAGATGFSGIQPLHYVFNYGEDGTIGFRIARDR